MATWEQLRSYINSHYHVFYVTQFGQLAMSFDLGNGRSQKVLVYQSIDGTNGKEWAKIESAVGHIDEVDLGRLFEAIRYQVVGGLAKNDDYVTVRHSIPLADMSVDEFEEPLAAVVETADHLEQLTSPVDRN
ncbi:hypothetical protein [Actinomycetospora aeridis]|uniref:Uncharacterized protein n=1 Tax=Actinomycetospora aeridis TaxID=3129231 RepID=A0ABU8N5Q9_9PSEU